MPSASRCLEVGREDLLDGPRRHFLVRARNAAARTTTLPPQVVVLNVLGIHRGTASTACVRLDEEGGHWSAKVRADQWQ